MLLGSIRHSEAEVLLGLLNSKDYTGLIKRADSISSAQYTTASEHRILNQLAAVIRKYPYPDGTVDFDPKSKALETFIKAEGSCSRHNKRFALFDSLRSPQESFLSRSASWIQYVLGDLSLSDVWSNCNFGAGASVGVHGNATNMARKLLSPKWSVSPSAFYYCYSAMLNDDHIHEYLNRTQDRSQYCRDSELFMAHFKDRVAFVDYNKIAFVPKTAKTLRTIAVEPLLNGFVQKGVDLLMRKRLKRVGIDLSDQTVNQELARKGSLPNQDDAYVTIDLSSASDSIGIGLCKRLLPPDWFEFLDSLRSKSYVLDNAAEHRYHKFTSMGNGFCFPLETLIFASLCHSAYSESNRKPDFSVYGDDIIVRQSVAPRVLEMLKYCGFTANRDKTFLSGPFRESCGADWYEGEDVRPLSLDYAFDSLESIFKFCNLARSKGAWESIFYESLDFLESLIPRELYFCRPYKGNVDTALEVPWDVFMASPFSRWQKHLQTWSWIEVVRSAWPDVPVKRFAGYDLALLRGVLSGSMSSAPFAERRKTCTKIRRICSGQNSNQYKYCAEPRRYISP